MSNINKFIYSGSGLDDDIMKGLEMIGMMGDNLNDVSLKDGSIAPASDAIDYANEMDLVESDDEDEESADNKASKPSSSTDVDNVVDSLLDNVLKKNASSMSKIELKSNAPMIVNPSRSEETSREIDARIRKLDQFKDIGTDTILRFSDIFVSKIPKDKAISLIPVPNWKDLDDKNIKEGVKVIKHSISDQEIFDELPRSENFHSEAETSTLEREVTPVYHPNEERTIPFGFSILDKNEDDESEEYSQNTHPYEDTEYAIVQHYPWEKEVIWSPETDGMDVEADEEEKTANVQDGEILYSIFPPSNRHLQWGEWDKTIIWDDEDPSQKKRYIRENRQIEVEMSDINMLFENKDSSDYKDDETEETDKSGETVKKKPRRRHLQLPSRVANASELILRNKQEALKQVDRFNLSNDKYYLEGKQALAQVQESTSVQHSLYALKYVLMKASLTTEELRNFHKPRFPLKKKFLYTIRSPYRRKEKRKAVLSVDIMKSKKDLSARDGRVILAEYIEEYPPLLLKIGMGSKIRNYYRKRTEDENKPSMMFQDGENVYLEPKDEPPFLGDIKPGTQLQSFENNLFKSPIFRHTPEDTDFLLIKKGDKFYVREIQTVYTVGQEQPLMEVPAPNSRQSNKFIKDRLKQYIHYMFRQKKLEVERNAKIKGKEIASLKISEVSRAFPGQSDNSIRKQLKECSEYQRGGDDSQSWVLKYDFTLPDENTIRNYVTLDEVCSYESMLACAQRLQDMGIERLNNATVHIHLAASSLPEPKRSIAKFIAQELELTTWNLSSNFFNATQNGKGILRLTGFGGPLRDGEAFSYLRLPQKIPNLKAEKEKEAKQQVSGTDRDLRKLTLPEATEILLQHGIPEEVINSLPRWKRIGKVRELANKAKFGNDQVSEDDTVKFARGSRHNVATHQQAYNDKCQTIFENHIRIISDPIPPKDPDEIEEDDEIGSLLEELDMSNSSSTVKLKSDEDYEQELYEKYFRSLDTEVSNQGKDGESDSEDNVSSSKSKKSSETVITTVVQSDVDLGGFTPETVPRTPTGQPAPYGYLKRSFTKPDGSTVVEYITDPKTIDAYRQKMEKKVKSGSKRVCRPVQEDEDQKLEKQKQKREKRRIQEKRRREKKNADKQRVLQERLESGDLNGALEGEGKNKLKCGRCGMIGHMRTNRICPMFDENEELTSNISRRRRKKRGRDDGDSDDDSTAEEQYIKSRRKIKKRTRMGKDSPQGILAEALKAIWEKIESNPMYYPFRYKVDKKEAPDYFDIVENPIHMGNVKDKLDKHDYDNVQEFLDDWNLMKSNCYEYNEFRNPHLLPIADKMLDEVQDLIGQNKERLNLIEQKIAQSNGFSQE